MAPSRKAWRRTLRLGMGPILLLSLSLFFAPASSRLVNITVDDTFGDSTTGLFPEYLPNNGTWNAGSASEDCPSCYIGPSTFNLTQIHNCTWHDTTYLPWETPATITVRFSGSAVYVFNILPNTLPSTITLANISFSIDGEDVGRFIRSPDSSSTILYDQLVYHNATLIDGPHVLTMTAGDNSLVLFDYLLYTTQGNDTTTGTSSDKSSSSSAPAGAIVGAVVGGVVLLGAATGGLFFYRKHRRSIAMQTAVHAYTEDSTSGASEGKFQCPVGNSEYHPYFPPPPTPMTPTSPAEPIVPSLGAPIARTPSDLASTGDVSGPDARLSPSTSTTDWSARRRAELTQRLEALQRTRSVLSSHAPSSPSRLDTSSTSESRTEAAIRELEAEMSQLRGVLSTLNARLADGHGGYLDPLPEYEE